VRGSRMWAALRRTALVAVGAGAMTAIGVATSSGASGGFAARDGVWGGGHFEGAIGGVTFVRDFSVNVTQGHFSGAGGSFVYGRNGFNAGVNSPSCIAVSGSRVVVGGVNQNGLKYLWYAIDNGTPASPTRDAATPVLLLEPDDVAQMPPGFPQVCPSPDPIIGGTPAFALTHGDIVVRDVS
jgi:hypothetical protein